MYACVIAVILMLVDAAQPDKGLIYNALIARHEALQSIVVEYEYETIPTPSKRTLEQLDGRPMLGGKKIHIHKDPIKTHEEFWYLDGRMRHEARVSAETQKYLREKHSPRRPAFETISVYTRHKYESLSRKESKAPPHRPHSGRVEDPGLQLSIDRDVELGLGLKSCGSNQWLKVSDFERAQIKRESSGTVVVTRDGGHYLHRWTYDSNRGYALTSYELVRDGRVWWALKNSDFLNVDGLVLPMQMEIRVFKEEDGDTVRTMTKRMTIHKYSLHHPENTPDKYNIVWPRGTVVYDNRIGVTFTADDSGELHPALEGSKEILDNIEKLPLELEDTAEANESMFEGEPLGNAEGKAEEDPNTTMDYDAVPEPAARATDTDSGFGRLWLVAGLVLLAVCTGSVVLYAVRRLWTT